MQLRDEAIPASGAQFQNDNDFRRRSLAFLRSLASTNFTTFLFFQRYSIMLNLPPHSSPKERNHALDAAKAIGIYLVVYGHYSGYHMMFFNVYSFHMPLFFFISGLLFRNDRTVFSYVIRKFNSLIKPTYLYVFLFAAISLIMARYTTFLDTNNLLYKITLDPFLSSEMIPFSLCFWFTTSLFLVSVFHGFLHYSILNRIRNNRLLFELTLFAVITAFTIYLSYNSLDDSLSIYEISAYRAILGFFYFYIGNLFSKYNLAFLFSNVWILLSIIIIQAFLFVDGPFTLSMAWFEFNGSPILAIVSSFTGIYCVLYISNILSTSKRSIMEEISRSTFHILALHLYCFFCLNCILYLINGYSTWNITGIYDNTFMKSWWPLYHVFGMLIPVWVGQSLRLRRRLSLKVAYKPAFSILFLSLPFLCALYDPAYAPGELVALGSPASKPFVGQGWGESDGQGRWTVQSRALIILPLSPSAPDAPCRLEVYGNPIAGRRVALSVNGVEKGELASGKTVARLSPADMKSPLRLVFSVSPQEPQTASDHAGAGDPLGYYLRMLRLCPDNGCP